MVSSCQLYGTLFVWCTASTFMLVLDLQILICGYRNKKGTFMRYPWQGYNGPLHRRLAAPAVAWRISSQEDGTFPGLSATIREHRCVRRNPQLSEPHGPTPVQPADQRLARRRAAAGASAAAR